MTYGIVKIMDKCHFCSSKAEYLYTEMKGLMVQSVSYAFLCESHKNKMENERWAKR